MSIFRLYCVNKINMIYHLFLSIKIENKINSLFNNLVFITYIFYKIFIPYYIVY